MKIVSRLYEFDALRAVATLLLLALHSEVFAFDNVFGVDLNPIALFVGAFLLGSFFFMAGYFEEISMAKNQWDWIYFLKTKFIRMAPPYWIALVLFVFVIGYSLKKPFDQWIYILNLQFIYSPAYVKQLLTLWFISVLVAYYLLFIILRSWIKSERVFFIALTIIFSILFMVHVRTQYFDIRFFEYAFPFFIGGFMARFPNTMEKFMNMSVYIKLLFWILGVYLLWNLQLLGYQTENLFFLITINLYIFATILFFLTLFRTQIGKWRIWIFISYASFFVYLYHRPVWAVLLKLFPQSTWRDETLFRLIPASIIAIIVSYGLQLGYDKLIQLLRNRFS